MSVLVVGTGRSGSTMALEALRGSPGLRASTKMDDNQVCKRRGKVYADDYLTKCHPVYFNYKQLKATLEENPKMMVVWTIRDFRDMCMSKIRRGQPKRLGGDCKAVARDATPDGCVAAVKKSCKMYLQLNQDFPGRTFLMKMEEVIENTEQTLQDICSKLDVPYDPSMCLFYRRMRNKFKKSRYKGIDKREVAKWKNWRTAYGGFLVKNGYDMETIFRNAEIKKYLVMFGYT